MDASGSDAQEEGLSLHPALDAELEEALRVATTHLGLTYGIISHIQDSSYVVEHVWAADGALEKGAQFELGKTYCSITLDADDITTIEEMRVSAHRGHPCYAAFQLESYVGMPIRLRGRPYGTLNFSGPQKRKGAYTETERGMVKLVGNWVERTLERQILAAQLQEALRDATEAHQSVAAIIEGAPDGIVIHRSGRAIWVNETLTEMLGAPAHELEGRSLIDFVALPSDRKRANDRLSQLAAGDRPEGTQELRLTRPDGRERWVETVGVPITWEAEPAAITFMRDKTDQRLAESQLLQSERLASIGTLAAGVAHELNNPLAYVVANLDVVAEELEMFAGASPSSRIRDIAAAVKEAREGAIRARKIVRDLRTFSRIDDEAREPQHVHRLLEVAISMSMNELRHRAGLERRFDPVPLVEADEARLTQVFVNLLVNASQAIPDDADGPATVTVVTRTDDEGRAVIEVLDTGTGIPEAIITRIFDPFCTTKPVGVGTGLGLSVSLQIIDELGGQLIAENRTTGGACFRVVLPAAVRDSLSPDSAETPRSAAPTSRRILVIDDDPMVAQSLKRVLGRKNEVLLCSDGGRALELLEADADFDVILCDLMMPEVPGWQLYQRLDELHPELTDRIVFVTGGGIGGPAQSFIQKVENPVVEKPFDMRSLRSIVDSVAQNHGRS